MQPKGDRPPCSNGRSGSYRRHSLGNAIEDDASSSVQNRCALIHPRIGIAVGIALGGGLAALGPKLCSSSFPSLIPEPLERLAQWNDFERIVSSQDGQIIIFIDFRTDQLRHHGRPRLTLLAARAGVALVTSAAGLALPDQKLPTVAGADARIVALGNERCAVLRYDVERFVASGRDESAAHCGMVASRPARATRNQSGPGGREAVSFFAWNVSPSWVTISPR